MATEITDLPENVGFLYNSLLFGHPLS